MSYEEAHKEYLAREINALNCLQQELDKNALSLKEQLESFVKNEDISWYERWEVWSKAPKLCKNHENSYPDMEDEDGNEVSWYDDFNMERRQVKTFEQICSRWDFDLKRAIEKRDEMKVISLSKKQNHFRNEFMIRNLYSFENDW